jgi:hypothetical protein
MEYWQRHIDKKTVAEKEAEYPASFNFDTYLIPHLAKGLCC